MLSVTYSSLLMTAYLSVFYMSSFRVYCSHDKTNRPVSPPFFTVTFVATP